MPTVPYQIDDAKTDAVAVSGKWRTVLPTDVAPALLADLGGAMQSGSFAMAANASPRRAAFNVTTTPNTTVQGDRYFDVEVYDQLPAGTSLTVGKVRTKITEDDVAGGGNTVVYGPQTTGDSGRQEVGSVKQRIEHPYVNARVAGVYMVGLDANGNGYAVCQKSDSQYDLRVVTAYSVGDGLASNDPSILPGSQTFSNFAEGDILAVDLINNRLFFSKNGEGIGATAGSGYLLPTTVAGTGAAYKKTVGTTVTDLKIIRLA